MAPYLGALAAELQSQDYSRKSIRRQLRNADSFGSWLTEQNLTVAEIADDSVDRYVGGLHRSARAGYVKSFMAYYHESKTHLSLAKDAPQSRPVQGPEVGRIVAIPQVGGLHYRYERRAA